MKEALDQTAQTIISCRSLLGVLKVPLPDSIQQKLIFSDTVQQTLILPDYDKMPESIRQKLIFFGYCPTKIDNFKMPDSIQFCWIVSNKS